ncbi:MAG TPA: lysylphosphatidylglycerol synthase transmembrane domain-containing protein [Polyangiaceae bacterium]|jgi:hypothetical protein
MSAPATPGPRPKQNALPALGLKLAASLLLAGACFWILQRGALRVVPEPALLRKIDYRWLTVYVAVLLFSHLVRALRWRFLLAPVGHVPLGTVLRVAWIGFGATAALPLRMGEAVRPLLIRRSGGISGWAATGTVGAERVIDGLYLSVMLFAALILAQPLVPLPSHIGKLEVPAALVPKAAYGALVLFGCAFSLLAAFHLKREATRRLLERVIGLVSPRLAHWVTERVDQIVQGIGFLSNARYTVPFLVGTSIYWFTAATAFWVMGRACGLDAMSFWQACAVMGVLGLGILVPNAPGFFGTFQLAVYAGLALYFPEDQVLAAGSLYVFVLYVCQVVIMVGLGALCLLFEPSRTSAQAEAAAGSP